MTDLGLPRWKAKVSERFVSTWGMSNTGGIDEPSVDYIRGLTIRLRRSKHLNFTCFLSDQKLRTTWFLGKNVLWPSKNYWSRSRAPWENNFLSALINQNWGYPSSLWTLISTRVWMIAFIINDDFPRLYGGWSLYRSGRLLLIFELRPKYRMIYVARKVESNECKILTNKQS